jgi:hypothetical protein
VTNTVKAHELNNIPSLCAPADDKSLDTCRRIVPLPLHRRTDDHPAEWGRETSSTVKFESVDRFRSCSCRVPSMKKSVRFLVNTQDNVHFCIRKLRIHYENGITETR